MALEVIDGDQRDLQRQRQRLGGRQPDDQGADQPGPRRHGDRAQIGAVMTPARRRASSIIGKIWRTCSRDAISGTTPPYRWCSPTCEATTLERIRGTPVRGGRGPSRTAAAVSSHVVSMARRIKCLDPAGMP